MTESVPREDPQPEKLPEEVFHYTSLDALIKIVNMRELWCTALPYLNDSKERIFIFEAVKRRLPYLRETDKSIDPDLGLRTFEADDVSNVTSFADEAFVACFAQNGDSLLHWRAYCPQQSGVAIGFRTQCLAEAHISEEPEAGMIIPRVSFGKVGYVDTRDTEIIDRVIYSAYESAKREVARGKTPWVLNEHFRWALDYLGCINKEKSFEVEDEWRLLLPHVRSRETNIQFRTVRSTIIPYVAMTVPNLTETGIMHDFEKTKLWNAIQSVVVGPTANMDLTVRSLMALFALRRMNVQIVESRVPYRDW
jgi:hypothetical protein